MRLPRMTTRRWMVAVAIVAMLLSVLLTYQRYATSRRMFLAYDHDSRFIRQTIWLNEQRVAGASRPGSPRRTGGD